MSLSECEKCGGHIPLGPNASNRCEKCGEHVVGSQPTMDPSMEVIKVTVLRCRVCGYERRLPGLYDPAYLDLRCPACVEPSRWAGWATKSGATPVRFDSERITNDRLPISSIHGSARYEQGSCQGGTKGEKA